MASPQEAGPSAAQVVQVIGVLYTQGADPLQQREANAWLSAFAASPGAWEAALSILSPPAPAAGAAPAEAQYFAANMLLSKVRSEWASKVPAEARPQLSSALWAALHAHTAAAAPPAGAPPGSAVASGPLVLGRLALALAAAAALSGAEAAMSLLNQAGALASGPMPILALELLQALAEEAEQLERPRRMALLPALRAQLPAALGLIESLAAIGAQPPAAGAPGGADAGVPGGPANGPLLRRALRSVQAWLELGAADLDNSAGGAAVLSLAQLRAARPELLSLALRALSADSEETSSSAADLLCSLLCGIGGASGAAPPAPPAAEADAAGLVLAAAVAQRPRVEADPERGPALGRLATALLERLPEVAAQAPGLPLADLMLAFVGSPEQTLVEAGIEYFLALSTVPTASRHPALAAPLYGRLLETLLPRAQHGGAEGAAGVPDAGSEEEEDFARFREQHVADALEATYALLRADYLSFLGATLAGAADWRRAEVAMFAARSVAGSLKPRLEGRSAGTGAAGKAAGAAGSDEQTVAAQVLGGLMARIGQEGGGTAGAGGAGGNLLSAHPLVIQSAARLVGAYASWLGRALPQGVAAVLPYLLRALTVPGAAPHAAGAFRNLCARCAPQLASPGMLPQLIEAAARAAGPGLDAEGQAAIVEGLARLVAALPAGAGAAQQALQLAAPHVARLRAALGAAAAGPPGPGGPAPLALSAPPAGAAEAAAAAGATAGELNLVASALRFMEATALGPGEIHPAMAILESAWPLLSALGAQGPAGWAAREPAVAEALGGVFGRAMLAAKQAVLPLLPHVLGALRALAAAARAASPPRPAAPALEAVGTAIEVYGATEAAAPAAASGAPAGPLAEAVDALMAALVAAGAGPGADGGPVPAGEAEVRISDERALLELGQRCVVFSPALVLGSAHRALPALLTAAAAAVGRRERDSARAALALLTALLGRWERAGAIWPELWLLHGPAVTACVAAHGERLAAALLLAAADSCPRHLLRTLAGALLGLLDACPAAGPQWVVAVVGSPQFPAAGEDAAALGEADRRLFLQLLLQGPGGAAGGARLPRPKQEALIADFASICRREATGDVLLAYQM